MMEEALPAAAAAARPAADDGATESPPHKKAKLPVSEEWDDDPGRFRLDKFEEASVNTLLRCKDQATKDQFRKHHRAFFQAKGYDIPIPPPECFKKTLGEVVPLDDPVSSKLVQDAAELALAEHRKRTLKNLKLVKVSKAIFARIIFGHEYYITLEAKEEGDADLPREYQTRVFFNDYGPHPMTDKVQAFRPKPKSNQLYKGAEWY